MYQALHTQHLIPTTIQEGGVHHSHYAVEKLQFSEIKKSDLPGLLKW
jgi:hypothetical protein